MTGCDQNGTPPPHIWPIPLARHADPADTALERAERGIRQVRRLLADGVPDPVGCRAALADLLTASEHLTALWALRGEWLRQVDGSDGGPSNPAPPTGHKIRSETSERPQGRRGPDLGPDF